MDVQTVIQLKFNDIFTTQDDHQISLDELCARLEANVEEVCNLTFDPNNNKPVFKGEPLKYGLPGNLRNHHIAYR